MSEDEKNEKSTGVDPPADPESFGLNDFEDFTLEHPESIAHTFMEIAAVSKCLKADQSPECSISRAELELALTRSAVTLQSIFPELSAIEGGVREVDDIVNATKEMFHGKLPFPPKCGHRIRVANRKINSLLNKLAQDVALIAAVQMVALGMTDQDPQWELVKYMLCGHVKPKLD